MSKVISYTKTVLDFKVKRNDSFRKRFRFFKKVAGVTSPDDISDSTFRMRISTKIEGGVIVKDLTLANGLTIENTNELIVEIQSNEMNMAAGTYYYDIQRTYTSGGVVVTRPEGRMFVDPDIS